MKANKSPLILNNFFLLNHQYNIVQPEEGVEIEELINNYYLDIDFSFQESEENVIQLFTKIGINNIETPNPGYSLFVEGVCVFSFNKSVKLTTKEESNLLHFSGLNIIINSLRNILANTTVNSPFGKYILPSIDVNKLLSDKQKNNTKSD